MHTPRMVMAALALTALVAGGCGSGGEPTTSPPMTTSPTASSTVPSTLVEQISGHIEWGQTFEVRLANGWTILDCDGDRLNVCFQNAAGVAGDMELALGYPLDPADRSRDEAEVALRLAQDMIDTFAADRAEGCPDFDFLPEEPVAVTVAGLPGARGGFSLVTPAGVVVEQVVNHYVVVGGQMAIINTDAYPESGGCLEPSPVDPSFLPGELAAVAPYLDRLAADSVLPEQS